MTGCEFGWKDYEGLCYTIIHYPYPPGGAIIDARSECRKRGADLISVKTEEYQLFIEDLFMDEVFLIRIYTPNYYKRFP